MRQELGLPAEAAVRLRPAPAARRRAGSSRRSTSRSARRSPTDEIAGRYARGVRGHAVRPRPLPPAAFPELKDVVGTPRAHVGWTLLSRAAGGPIVVSAIDNLLKGAASQAVQNLNRVFGLPETEGLL